METLIINIPEKKSDLVKTLLTELDVTYEQKEAKKSSYKEDLLKISIWDEADFENMELAAKSFP